VSRRWDKPEIFNADRREQERRQDGQREKRAGDGQDSQRPKGQYIRERDLTDRLEYVRTIRATAEAPVPLSLRSNVVAMLLRRVHARAKRAALADRHRSSI